MAQDFQKFNAWLDIQEVDGKKLIVGWLTNNTAVPTYIQYEAAIRLNGKIINTKKGTTLALPSSPTLLTKAIFTLQDDDFDHISLSVVNRDNEILAFAKITNAPISPLPEKTEPQTDQPEIKLPVPKNPQEFEIDGLVLDETRSKLARDFYETFYRNWSSIQVDTKGQTIIVREMPGRIGIGTSVIVEVDDRQLTQLNLQPRTELIEDLAGQLVEALESFFNDPNNHSVIESNDLIGSGVY